MDELLYSIELNAKAITSELIKEASMLDNTHKALVEWILQGSAITLDLLPTCLRPFWRAIEIL